MTAGPGRTLHRYPGELAIVSLAAGSDIPAWAGSTSVFAVVATATETTLVCSADAVPTKTRRQAPYAAFAVAGTLDLALTGVLNSLLAPLAEADVPVFTISTYPTDWILVPTATADRATEVWEQYGHTVTAPTTEG